MKRLFAVTSAALIALFLCTSLAGANNKGSNWAQFRGPDAQGISTETSFPLEWSETKNVKWKTPIPGKGHSSPIVWGNRIFLTADIEGEVVPGTKPADHVVDKQEFKHPDWAGADRKHTMKVVCVDADTGKVLWEQTSYEGTVFDYRHRRNTFASPTPVTDGRMVYAWFGSEGLYAYDSQGPLAW